MGFLIGLLYAVDIIVALLLIGIILIQQSKSGGGLGAIAGGMGESVFGAAAGNVITKTTVVLCALFLGVTLLLAVLSGRVGAPESLAERLEKGAAATEEADVEIDEATEAEGALDPGDAVEIEEAEDGIAPAGGNADETSEAGDEQTGTADTEPDVAAEEDAAQE